MISEIKFRGKRKDNNAWVTGSLIIENPPLQCFPSEKPEGNKYLIGKSGFADWNMPRPFTAAEVFPESIAQFTGIKDKNKNDIFGDDLMKDSQGRTFRVYQVAGGFVIKADYWLYDCNELVPGDELIFESLSDSQTQAWITQCEIVCPLYDNKPGAVKQ